jgi:nitrate/nitrite-specific signal transduction histidine kinase
VVVGRVQDILSKARQATFMYELSSALANARTQDAVVHTVARYIRQLFQALQVNVTFQQSKQTPRIAVTETQGEELKRKPDRILALLNTWGLVGEIQIWPGEFSDLPEKDSLLLQNLASQAARVFERTQNLTMEQNVNVLSPKCDRRMKIWP